MVVLHWLVLLSHLKRGEQLTFAWESHQISMVVNRLPRKAAELTDGLVQEVNLVQDLPPVGGSCCVTFT